VPDPTDHRPVIHVLTVHWNDSRWIPCQIRHLRSNVKGPHRLWAFLNGLDDTEYEHWKDSFHFTNRQPIEEHSLKLNLLADLVAEAADTRPDDILLFLDGDAFPIAPIDDWLRQQLAEVPLVAVQRRENLGDRQPHPSFAATTVGFWQGIGGTWIDGHTWTNSLGQQVTDVGGNLLAILEKHGIEWRPLLRSNKHDIHPVLFGVYGDVVYHHGAGFYKTVGGRIGREALRQQAAILDRKLGARLRLRLPRRKRWKHLRRNRPAVKMHQEVRRNVAAMSKAVYEQIVTDQDFHLGLTDPESGKPLSKWRLELVPEKWLLPSQRRARSG